MTRTLCTFSLGLLGLLVALPSATTLGSEPDKLEPIVVGSPMALEVFPPAIRLSGARQQMQMVVTGRYADGRVQDLTRAATFNSADAKIATVESAVVRPAANGKTEIVVEVGGQSARLPVEVLGLETKEPVSFEYGVLAALSKQGCNSGACHGSPSGKGGFRLSLRAFDPAVDQLTLLREASGRRVNAVDPESSLLLAKPMMKVPHGGGLKMTRRDVAFNLLRDWMADGCQLDAADAPRLTGLEIYPPTGRELHWPAHTQQLSVLAKFSDGSSRDVTSLAVYSSSDESVAEVSVSGLAAGLRRGEAAILVRYMDLIQSVFVTFARDVEGFVWQELPQQNYIDELTDAKLKQLQYQPSPLCSDDEFLRRAYLDIIGVLPTVAETRAYLADPAPDKRAKLIDALLARPDYAKFWALKWGDLLRVTNKSLGADGLYKYHRWLERAVQSNMPYDQFARSLLTASGPTLSNPPANFYRTATDTNDCVESISQLFLGARLQCAKCHNHPFERWSQDNYYGMAAFFNRLQRTKTERGDELFIWAARTGEVTQPRTGKQMKPWLPASGEIEPPADQDRRQAFADWLTRPDNPIFAKVEANRIWSQVFGRGIVDPPDDFRESNPPSNAALLDALARDFAQNGFDRKRILKTILNSRTYQASSQTNGFNKEDEKYFSHFQPRLLSAEQLLEAIAHITGVPEQFASLPASTRATQLPSPDLANNEFLKAFGQPERQTVCQCERSSDSNLGQALQLFNGPLVHGKLRAANNRFRQLIAASKSNAEIIDELYVAGLCRPPQPGELQAALAHVESKPNREEALEDVCWAVINTNEFLFQH